MLEYRTSDLGDQGKVEKVGLDQTLMASWKKLEEGGSFRYELSGVRERRIPGPFAFLAQFLPQRATLRRPPQAMMSLTQLPDPQGFNFTKVDEARELVFQLRNLEDAGEERNLLLINVSPIDQGHSLLVPWADRILPQQVTFEGALLALHLLSLSSSPNIRIAFNSLCAFASVNHQHWHVYYTTHRSAVVECPVHRMAGPLHTWTADQYPALGWCLQVATRVPGELATAARSLATLTRWLVEGGVAHNVFLCPLPGGRARVIVWPRESVVGAKDPGAFVMAVCELSGQVLMYEDSAYETITEEQVAAAQAAATTRLYEKLSPSVEQLFES